MRSALLTLALSLTLLGIVATQERPLPDYETFTAQVKKHLATDEARQSGYTFIERRIEQRLDASGRTTEEAVKVFEVYPGLPGEDRYRRLIEEDGKPVPPDKLAQQDRERQRDVESYARKLSSEPEREKATRAIEKERARYSAAVDDIFRVYDIRMAKRESIEGHDTILATLTPKADAGRRPTMAGS